MTSAVTTQLMAPGHFRVDLADDTPEHIARLTSRAFSAVIVLPGRIFNPAKTTLAELYASAWYVGIHTARPDLRLGFSGFGPAFLLKLAKVKAENRVSKRPLYHGTNSSWLYTNVLRISAAEDQGLEVGPITAAASAATPKKPGKVTAGQEPLDVLSDICRRFGKEWDIRNGYQLEVADREDLFETDPTVVATPRHRGDDLKKAGLDAARFKTADDWDNYATEYVVGFDADDYEFGVAYEVGDTVVSTSDVYYECKAAHTSSGANLPPNGTYWTEVDSYGTATVGTVPYRSPFSGDVILSRRVEKARSASTYDDATDIASHRLDRFNQARTDVTLDTETWQLNRVVDGPGKVRAGDYIWVYSPEHELYNYANEVKFRGRTIPAARVRVQSIATNIDETMSVLVYSYDTAASAWGVADVSRWVEFGSPGQRLELGQPRRRRGASLMSTGISPAVAGNV